MNDTPSPFSFEMVLTNAAAEAPADGWVLIAPHCTKDSQAEYRDGTGAVRQAVVRQVIDAQVCNAIVEHFNSVSARVLRWFSGVPVYYNPEEEHPDRLSAAGRTKPREVATVSALEAREGGLYGRFIFNSDGRKVLKETSRLAPSCTFWADCDTKAEPLIGRPKRLESIGLTQFPNLKDVTLLNADPQIMNRKLIIAALLKAGLTTLPETADDAAVVAGIETLSAGAARAATLEGQLTNAQGESQRRITDLELQLTNSQSARDAALLDLAIQTGRITPAERDTYAARLKANFEPESKVLLALAPKVQVLNSRAMADAPERKTGAANTNPQATASRQLNELARKKLGELPADARSGPDAWIQCYNAACKDNPELVQLMNTKGDGAPAK